MSLLPNIKNQCLIQKSPLPDPIWSLTQLSPPTLAIFVLHFVVSSEFLNTQFSCCLLIDELNN